VAALEHELKTQLARFQVKSMIGKSIRLGSVHFSTDDRTEYLYVPEIDRDAQRRYVLSCTEAASEDVLSKARLQVEAVPGHDDQIRLVSRDFSTAAKKAYLFTTSILLDAQHRYVCSWKGPPASGKDLLSKARFQVEAVPGHDDQIRLVSVHFGTAARKEYLYVAATDHSAQGRYIVSRRTAASDDVLSKARFQVERLE
jgi:hypothetical protein